MAYICGLNPQLPPQKQKPRVKNGIITYRLDFRLDDVERMSLLKVKVTTDEIGDVWCNIVGRML